MKTLLAALCTTACITVALLNAGAAAAQTVWRCGPDGREYREQPCAEGRSVDVADPRSAAQVQAARAIAAREQRMVAEMAAHRRRFEASAHGAGAASVGPTAPEINPPSKPKRAAKKAKRQRWFADAGTSPATAHASR